MKKTFKFVGVVMTSVALLFASCKNSTISIDADSTGNPEIFAKAYPGYNMIIASPVVDGYTNILRDDGKWFEYAPVYDYDVEDGVEYTYTLYTTSKVDLKVGNKTSVMLKAIKPEIAGEKGQTHALDLAYYEDGEYNADASKDFIVSAENIKVKSDDTKIFITFPEKIYLDYEVKLYKGNSVELLPKPLANSQNAHKAAIDAGKFKTDVTAKYYAEITGAGEYRVQVTVSGKNGDNYAEDKIIAKETAKIEALEVSDSNYTRDVKAVFTDTTNKKVRVTWSPAKKLDGELYPVTNYTVYAYDDNTKEVEKVTDTIKASKKDGEDVYFVETEKVNDKYVAVLSDNGKYEDRNLSNITSNSLVWYEKETAFYSIDALLKNTPSFTSLDSDYKYNDFVIDFNNYLSAKQTLSVKYVIYDPANTNYHDDNWYYNNFSSAFVSADYVTKGEVKTDSETGDITCTIKNVPTGQKVAYEITVSEEGKKDAVKSYISEYTSY